MLARAGKDLRAPGVHHHAAVRLLVVADAHHVDRAFQPEQLAGERERAAPLAGAGLRGQPLDARALVVIRLRDRGVRLVAAGGTGAFVLVIDVRRRIQQLSPGGARGRAAWRATGDRCPSPRREYRSSGFGENSCSINSIGKSGSRSCGVNGARVCGMKRRVQRFRQRRQNVDPDGGNLAIGKQEFGMLGHGRDYYNRRTLAFNAEKDAEKTRPVFSAFSARPQRLRVESV